ncbi:phosphotriesterase-related protein [Vibrio sp. ES.051]|uniref:phosphotriesterase family protein n=1 Tax=Vibrio sp. ES.051 TaxID=1761909 RepID=UPI000BF47108|nr:phosphotriesterase-related protein [Vibrio sp. ES.051]PFG58348.1 phosphotriesterase-related protein [Vibrio sp. ES.051]
MAKFDPGYYTYCHEHLHINLSPQKNDEDCFLNEFSLLCEELTELKKRGVHNIVEVTNKYIHRDVEFVNKLMQATGINVLMSTGYYIEGFFPSKLYDMNVNEIAKTMVDELTLGMDGTTHKASVIGEIGSSKNEFTPTEQKVFRAAAIAHKETGAPISTHTSFSTMGRDQVKLLSKYNIDMTCISIGHCDLRDHFDDLLWLLDAGCNIQFDTIGKNSYYPDSKRAQTLKMLIDRGYARQIMLSMDVTRRSHLSKNGGLGFCYLIDSFVPMLKAHDISDIDIETMLRINPAQFFTQQ